MPITVRPLRPDERHVLSSVAAGVFDRPVDDRWAGEFFADPRHHLVVAFDGDVVVGMASGVHYVHPDKPPELWINEIGVAPPYRGRGTGGRLLDALLDVGRQCGCGQAWVLTEHANAPAMRLYAGRRGTAGDQVMFGFDLRGNRPAE